MRPGAISAIMRAVIEFSAFLLVTSCSLHSRARRPLPRDRVADRPRRLRPMAPAGLRAARQTCADGAAPAPLAAPSAQTAPWLRATGGRGGASNASSRRLGRRRIAAAAASGGAVAAPVAAAPAAAAPAAAAPVAAAAAAAAPVAEPAAQHWRRRGRQQRRRHGRRRWRRHRWRVERLTAGGRDEHGASSRVPRSCWRRCCRPSPRPRRRRRWKRLELAARPDRAGTEAVRHRHRQRRLPQRPGPAKRPRRRRPRGRLPRGRRLRGQRVPRPDQARLRADDAAGCSSTSTRTARSSSTTPATGCRSPAATT